MTNEEIIAACSKEPSMFEGMVALAKQQSIAFMNWTLGNDCNYYCSDENVWTHTNGTHENVTTEQLYDQFIEQQSKEQ